MEPCPSEMLKGGCYRKGKVKSHDLEGRFEGDGEQHNS